MAQKGQALCNLSISNTNKVNSIQNLDDAFQMANDLESSDINIVFNFLKLKLVPDSEKTSLSPDVIERHLHKLVDFPKTFGDAPMRKSIDVDA
jgi:hypothetical protein